MQFVLSTKTTTRRFRLAGTLFAKHQFKQNRQCSSDSSEYESCSEEEEIQTENELQSASETPERSCSDDTSADEGKI